MMRPLRNPKYAKAYYNRGTAKVALKEYKEAIKDYDEGSCAEPSRCRCL